MGRGSRPLDSRLDEMASHLALASVPTVYVDHKDVETKANPFSASQTYIGDCAWT